MVRSTEQNPGKQLHPEKTGKSGEQHTCHMETIRRFDTLDRVDGKGR